MASDLIKEIKSVEDFWTSRAGAEDASATPSLMASFKSSLVCQINAIAALSADEGKTVNTALRKVPFPDGHLQARQLAIDSKVVMTVTKPAKAGKPGSAKQQTIANTF